MGEAVEQVAHRMVRPPARGTERLFGHANPRLVGAEKGAVAGAELGQGGTVGTGKGCFLPLDRWRAGLEEGVWCELADGSSHCRGVEVCEGGSVAGGVCGPACEQVGHCWEKTGLKGVFHLASAGRGSNGGEQGVGRT